MKIAESTTNTVLHPLWRLAFRAGFLLTGLFAVLSMTRWLYWMWRPETWDFRLFPGWWHAHEMLFGFTLPAIAGFLLSAVVVWTGLPGTKGLRLQILFALWCTARAVLWLFPAQLALAWLAEVLFMGLLIFELTKRLWAARQWRNMVFPAVLLILTALSSASYWSASEPQLARRLHYGAAWMVAVLVVIVAGRVVPAFTGKRLGIQIPPLPPALEFFAVASTALIGLASTLWTPQQTSHWLPLLCLAGCLCHLLRLGHWQGWRTLHEPLLWSLHLSYLCIPLTMLGLALIDDDAGASQHLLHLMAIGSIGGMLLAMMSRVALGHTGRPLTVPAYIAAAFAMLFVAAMVRALLPLLDLALTSVAWRLAAILWIIAFSLYLLRYYPILTRPRLDGKPG